MDIILPGLNGRFEGRVRCNPSNADAVFDPPTIVTFEIHMDHAEVGPWIPCLKLAESAKKSMILSAVYAANLLFSPPSAVHESKVVIDSESLEKLTMAVERELRSINVEEMRATDFRYRVNVHSHFKTAETKGATTTKILHRDINGSHILIKGPYASSVDTAISELETDLLRKLQERLVTPEKADGQDWMLNILPGGAKHDEPALPSTTWAAVNFGVVSASEAEKTAVEDEKMCRGEYVLKMGEIQPPLV